MRRLSANEDTIIKDMIESMISEQVIDSFMRKVEKKKRWATLSRLQKEAKARQLVQHVVRERYDITDLLALTAKKAA